MTSQKATPIPDDVGQLLAARLKSASEERDVDKLMSHYAQDATFRDVVNDLSISGWDAIRDFYTAVYQSMPVFKIEPVKLTIADNCLIVELKCEGNMAVAAHESSNDDQSGTATSATVRMVGVTLLWWRWEGSNNETQAGDTSSEASVLGWKIFEERTYVMRS